MNRFKYRKGELFCEELNIESLAKKYGTPLYLYSKNMIRDKFQAMERAFAGVKHTICYALKANSNVHIIKLIASLGGGADVVSGGELFLAQKAGIPAKKIVYAGVGKTDQEIKYGIQSGILAFNVESEQELTLIAQIAQQMGKKAPVAIRVNPDIDIHGHPYISTGKAMNKFGIDIDTALNVFKTACNLAGIEIVGLHCHIGSQILNLEYFVAASKKLLHLVHKLTSLGIQLQHVDIGGGLGVRYPNLIPENDEPTEVTVPSPDDLARSVIAVLKPLQVEILFEPGRSIVGEAAALITRVIYVKKSRDKNFIVVDAGMNDLIRPSLYQAYHQIVPLRQHDGPSILADVVGPICETGDFLARDRSLPMVQRDDYLAVMTAGAYGYSLASNYNSRPRPIEVWVDGDQEMVIRKRETIKDLTRL